MFQNNQQRWLQNIVKKLFNKVKNFWMKNWFNTKLMKMELLIMLIYFYLMKSAKRESYKWWESKIRKREKKLKMKLWWTGIVNPIWLKMAKIAANNFINWERIISGWKSSPLKLIKFHNNAHFSRIYNQDKIQLEFPQNKAQSIDYLSNQTILQLKQSVKKKKASPTSIRQFIVCMKEETEDNHPIKKKCLKSNPDKNQVQSSI